MAVVAACSRVLRTCGLFPWPHPQGSRVLRCLLESSICRCPVSSPSCLCLHCDRYCMKRAHSSDSQHVTAH